MTPSRIHRLTLTHFRNYRAASVATRGDVIVLVGPNGAGKTNAIEAISFLSPGRGLRRATLDDVADNQGDGSWAVSAEVEGALGLATLGTGIDAPAASRRSTAPCARATGYWKCATTTTIGATRSNAKPRNSPWQWRPCAARP